MLYTSVYLVTHGAKEKGNDPHMKPEEFSRTAALRHLLPARPSLVIAGTGQRHQDVAAALGLQPTRWSGALGDPESLERMPIDGNGEQDMVRLACGVIIPLSACTTPWDMAPATDRLIVSLPHLTVACSGRPAMIALGEKNAESASVYEIRHADGHVVEYRKIA